MRTVLVIDDNPVVGTALSLLSGLHDITTLTAASPQAGLASLATHRVDLVIADMNFSGDTTSGQEGVALFRDSRARYADMPVILLTAWTRLESAVQLVKAGAADYVAKPWDNDPLLASVENLLELSESVRITGCLPVPAKGGRATNIRNVSPTDSDARSKYSDSSRPFITVTDPVIAHCW